MFYNLIFANMPKLCSFVASIRSLSNLSAPSIVAKIIASFYVAVHLVSSSFSLMSDMAAWFGIPFPTVTVGKFSDYSVYLLKHSAIHIIICQDFTVCFALIFFYFSRSNITFEYNCIEKFLNKLRKIIKVFL